MDILVDQNAQPVTQIPCGIFTFYVQALLLFADAERSKICWYGQVLKSPADSITIMLKFTL